MKHYIIVFFNRIANQTHIYEVKAESEYRAGRDFYKKYNRNGCRIECIYMSKFNV